ncbi:hypothetical protein A2U01_0098614, partial [Trifolium medium]|nr:hypothetical protein [Trifolium medium]
EEETWRSKPELNERNDDEKTEAHRKEDSRWFRSDELITPPTIRLHCNGDDLDFRVKGWWRLERFKRDGRVL